MTTTNKSKQAPALVTYLELNKNFGHGYQARLVMDGIIDSTIDDEPYSLDECYSGATFAIEQINKETGYNYDPQKVIRVTDEALQANKRQDFISARIARDIDRGRGELAVPLQQDCMTKIIDGQEETVFTGRGVILMAFFSWLEERLPKAREALRRYCEYLALHGYGGCTAAILAEIDSMSKDRGADWIRASYGRFVEDDAAIIRIVMGG